MQINAVRDTPDDPSQAPTQHRWSVADFYRMAEAGLISEGDRMELIEGELIDMAPIGSRHAFTVTLIAGMFRTADDRCLVSVQNPVRLSAWSEPQPDIALLKPRNYSTAHPGPDDVLLIVEVSDSTLKYDRDVKLTLYARHGIPEVWLIDLQQNRLTQYRDPTPQGYRRSCMAAATDVVEPAELPGLAVRVSEVFGGE